MTTFINPPELPAPLGLYSHVAVTPDKGLVFVAGQLPVDAAGDVVGVGDLAAQMKCVFGHIGTALAAEGLAYGHIVQMTTYLVGRECVAPFFECRAELFPTLFGSAEYPPNTLLLIDGLVLPDARIEVQVIAAL